MSIWVNENTKVVVQGITGKAAMHHTKQMLEYGTSIVAGVTPGKGNEIVLGIPVFNTVKEAVNKTQANTSIIYVPAEFAAKAIVEAVDADIKLVICITGHAGAIISENMGTATAKIEALELAGVRVVKNIESLIENIKEVMENNAK